MDPWRRSLLRGALVFAVALGFGGARAWSQVLLRGGIQVPGGRPNRSVSDGTLAQNVFLPADRAVLQRLAKARKLLEEARYGEAVRYLGAILDGPEDYFFQPDKKVPIHRSLKAEARRLIGQMPPEGRELYEFEYGARARQMLTEAIASGDAVALAEVSRRFFHTQSGYEATLLLGLHHFDRGRPLAGAIILQRLRDATPAADQFEPTLSLAMATCWLQAGMPEKARGALSPLKKQQGDVAVEVAGKQVSLFAEEVEALGWLTKMIGPQPTAGPDEADSWVMFRGNAARNATAAGGAPLLNMRWRVPTTKDPLLEEKLRRDRQACLDRGIPVLPGLHPLTVDDVVLMRTARNLLAVDFGTGRRLWEVPVDDPSEAALSSNASTSLPRNTLQAAAAWGYRIWADATYGTMSSDGNYVFTVEDLPVGIGIPSRRSVIVNGRRVTSPVPKPCSRLAAYEVRTGKLKWHLGGPSDQFALRQAETFFLGPPLPLMGRLYVLAEAKGEIRLSVLDAQSGNLLWSQQLAIVERDILQDPFRRLAGASPSYADGILVCPTSTGAVVAVDLATRSLLWGYRYERPELRNAYRAVVFFGVGGGAYSSSHSVSHWSDATAIVVDGRVLVTPIESDWLHCLNLIDGELLWKSKRSDDLYVACVHQDKVVLVGRRQVRAVSLSETVEKTETVRRMERTGGGLRTVTDEVTVAQPKLAWALDLPEGTMPSGRGFFTGEQYFVPLTSAEVLAIDLATGKSASLSRSRKGNVPGNLICHKGSVISQGVDGVEKYYQLAWAREEVRRRAAASPGDPEALSLRGELLLDEGNLPEAIACLHRGYERADELDEPGVRIRTRTLLRQALFDGLRLQFAAHRNRGDEIEQLLDNPAQRATYLRLMATGLQRAGERRAALDHYLKLIDLDRRHRVTEALTKSLSVRLDRWLQVQLAVLRREAQDEAAVIDRTIEARLQAALKANTTDSLRRFLDYFGSHPSAGEAHRELIQRLKDSGRWLEAELLLWPELWSSDRKVAGPALAELAELLRQAERPEDAAVCYRRLGREFADVVCRDGKTGQGLVDALPDDGRLQQVLRSDAGWPVGKVDVEEKSAGRARVTTSTRLPLSYQGSLAPFFSDTAIQFDPNRRLVLRDALGNERWRVSLVGAVSRYGVRYNPSTTHARVCGHLLLLSMGSTVLAVDTLGRSDTGEPRVLWTRDPTDSSFDVADFRVVAGGIAPWAIGSFQVAGYPGAQMSGLGLVTSRYACFQQHWDLVAADPLTGEVFWIRHGVAPGSMLFGDDQFVFALPPDKSEAMVFRALDGRLLGKREVPHLKHSLAGSRSAPRAAFGLDIMIGGITHVRRSGTSTAFGEPIGRHVLIWHQEGHQAVLELFDPWEQRQVWPLRKFPINAKCCMVGQEAIGVFEPNGRFVLVALPDGRSIADVKLEPEQSLTEILIFRSGDQYILVTHSPPRDAAANRQPARPMSGTRYKLISGGRVYAFDLKGNAIWPKPVEVKNQHLLLDQPGRLPVLTFACQTYLRNPQNNKRYQVSIFCIDKQTGREIDIPSYFTNSSSRLEIVGDPENHTVELRTRERKVVLTFTGQPIPPPSTSEDEKGDAPPEPPKITRTLWQALQKAISDAARKSTDQADDSHDAEPEAE